MRMLTIIGGVLMLLTGIFCFINPGQTFLAIAFVIYLHEARGKRPRYQGPTDVG